MADHADVLGELLGDGGSIDVVGRKKSKKTKSLKTKAQRKAELTRLYRECRKEFNYLTVIELSSRTAIFLFAGTRIEMEYCNGQALIVPNHGRRWIPSEDYVFLTTLGIVLMKAVHNGYKNVKKGKEERKRRKEQGIPEVPTGVHKLAQLRLL